MKEKHLIVISVDALVYEDLEYAKTLPNFGRILENGSIINRVKTIYPSLTHPVHVSILTGCPAGVTGVYSNDVFSVSKGKRPWINFMSQIKCDTILHAAKRAGLTTAVCRWPVTAGASDVVDYLIPEFFDVYLAGYGDDVLGAYKNIGSKDNVADIINEMVKRYGTENKHPQYDEAEMFAAAEIIKKYKPNLMFIHPGYVDNARHRTGLFTDEVKKAVKETDKWIGWIFDSVKEAGIEENTDIVVLSDHGHLNICRCVCPNVFLADKGYITLNANDEIESWKAYIASCGLSAQVYLADKTDKELYNSVYTLLKNMADEKLYGFEKVFTADEAKDEYGLYGDFSFVLETDGFSSFGESALRPVVRSIDISDYRYGASTHGHMPEKGPQPPFMAMGPSFKKGVVIENGNILNHAQTFAKVLGLSLPQSVGEAVDEILA
ncbi:MAG: alkaline phosphatase family protein [Clostridia bacterium]|nr:alkaline phosphatase family protein [Clostridia bacterium]